jgi:hypothetical protein
MDQTRLGWPLSFSLSAENRAVYKGQSLLGSALSSASRRRSGCSPAVPYPPHECQESTIFAYSSLRRGHFYFVKKGTFLLWVDKFRWKNLEIG